MSISVFDLFSIGIGPSSSHTVGPMRAAQRFTELALAENALDDIAGVLVEVFGSLAWTGHGHGTVQAILLGLEGEKPESVDPERIEGRAQSIQADKALHFAGQHSVALIDFVMNKQDLLPFHSNGLRFTTYDQVKAVLTQQVYYSVGGGFVLTAEEAVNDANDIQISNQLPYPFRSARELVDLCSRHNLTVAELMWANETSSRSKEEVRQGLLALWAVMQSSLQRGCATHGTLPGSLKVRRRAASIYQKLQQQFKNGPQAGTEMNRLSVYAIAINEENAAGGRVVTAPTNGAAGIIPAVLQFALEELPEIDPDELVCDFLLTSAAIGQLYKENASISAAEVGCQGEVGVACSMAAAAFAAVCGATVQQVENSAEIGMEHHLGLTCDPIAGLVQIPCIERNAMGAVQAVNAARLACLEDGQHKVSLDEVIATMRQTGKDMLTKYKETAQGGLAVNVPHC